MSTLDLAIVELQATVDSYGQGTPNAPPPNTKEWFELRAYVLALAYCKRLKVLELDSDPASAEGTYKQLLALFKGVEVPNAPA